MDVLPKEVAARLTTSHYDGRECVGEDRKTIGELYNGDHYFVRRVVILLHILPCAYGYVSEIYRAQW